MARKARIAPTELVRTIHSELAELMERRGYSQRTLSEAVGISQNRISLTIGTNSSPLDLVELEKICAELAIDPVALMHRSQEIVALRNSTQSNFVLAAKKQMSPRTGIEDYE